MKLEEHKLYRVKAGHKFHAGREGFLDHVTRLSTGDVAVLRLFCPGNVFIAVLATDVEEA
jgi:hypothetical protein